MDGFVTVRDVRPRFKHPTRPAKYAHLRGDEALVKMKDVARAENRHVSGCVRPAAPRKAPHRSKYEPRVLGVLQRCGPMTASDIARMVNVSSATVRRALRHLKAAGGVETCGTCRVHKIDVLVWRATSAPDP